MKRKPGHDKLEISVEIKQALAGGRPVVALESTIIAHGMPYPRNVETARAVEALIRTESAVPATIAIVAGSIKVGLGGAELERFGAVKSVGKASRRDIAACVAAGATAGTTVAATMAIAALAGIEVFATGGIGGVHRGAADSFDISADLLELARTPVAVVCSGCKSILDIAKTLEVLETHGVPVLGYRTNEFPAFYARSSGHMVEHRFEDVEQLAAVIDLQRRLGLSTGILVANPIPEEDALQAETIEAHIAIACRAADAGGVTGKLLTPFLLARLNELTAGASLKANIALIGNNARLAARIAVAMTAERTSLDNV